MVTKTRFESRQRAESRKVFMHLCSHHSTRTEDWRTINWAELIAIWMNTISRHFLLVIQWETDGIVIALQVWRPSSELRCVRPSALHGALGEVAHVQKQISADFHNQSASTLGSFIKQIRINHHTYQHHIRLISHTSSKIPINLFNWLFHTLIYNQMCKESCRRGLSSGTHTHTPSQDSGRDCYIQQHVDFMILLQSDSPSYN